MTPFFFECFNMCVCLIIKICIQHLGVVSVKGAKIYVQL